MIEVGSTVRIVSQPEHTVPLWGSLVGLIGSVSSIDKDYDNLVFVWLGEPGGTGPWDFPFEKHELEHMRD